MNEQLKQFNLTQLKAFAYDASVNLAGLQQQLQILNQEIQERSKLESEQKQVKEPAELTIVE
jgi:paraquat-inducible protein B